LPQLSPHPVDLVVREGDSARHGHARTLLSQRRISLLPEHVTKVGDGKAELRHARRGRRADAGESRNDGRRFVVAAPVKERREQAQRRSELGDVCGVVVVADGKSNIVERYQRFAVCAIDPIQCHRQRHGQV
jgi:hypothetical protein